MQLLFQKYQSRSHNYHFCKVGSNSYEAQLLTSDEPHNSFLFNIYEIYIRTYIGNIQLTKNPGSEAVENWQLWLLVSSSPIPYAKSLIIMVEAVGLAYQSLT
jgi:hypothetical protein